MAVNRLGSIIHKVLITTVKRLYKSYQISKLKSFSSRLTVVFTQSIEARCYVKYEDVVGAAPTGDAPNISEWSKILLHTMVRLVFKVLP